MPILPNPRHEKFAQAQAEGKPAMTAYKLAGYKPDRSAASRTSAKVHIYQRVDELRDHGAEQAAVTLKSLIHDASNLQKRADARGQYSAAVAALTVKAKLSGFWVDRSENDHVVYAISDKPMSKEEWKAKYCTPVIEDQRDSSPVSPVSKN